MSLCVAVINIHHRFGRGDTPRTPPRAFGARITPSLAPHPPPPHPLAPPPHPLPPLPPSSVLRSLSVVVTYISWLPIYLGYLYILVTFISWLPLYLGYLYILVTYISWLPLYLGYLYILVTYISLEL